MRRPTPEPDHRSGAKQRDRVSRWDDLVFTAKAFGLRRLRQWRDLRNGRPRRHPVSDALTSLPVSAAIQTPLWTGDPGGPHDRALTAGKIHNLRRAIGRIDGVEIPAGAIFSFWAQVGRPVRLRGFVPGRELREGCVTASVGGGLCQLSNALYSAALEAGLEIVERHAHSMIVPGSEAEAGRDATVFWNYVDLRLRSDRPFRIEAHLTGRELVVTVRGNASMAAASPAIDASRERASDCIRCGQVDCRRHAPEPAASHTGASAWLIEAPHAEFAAWFADQAQQGDHLYLPTRLGPRGAQWPSGHCPESTADVEAVRRRMAARRAASGAILQRGLLESDARLARTYARRLSHLHTHLVVSQALLPHLWLEGVLQGRTFDVLLDRLPYAQLHDRLDGALGRHPESLTLGEFRAPADLVDAERAALASARRLITAHSSLARLFPRQVRLIEWPTVPPMRAAPGGRHLLLPASALARKGAFSLREALRGLEVPLIVSGQAIEHDGFWSSLPVHTLEAGEPLPPLAGVVLPALIDHRPEPLMAAMGAGVPVVATDACGLGPRPGLTLVPRDDVDALRAALASLLAETAGSP